MPLGMESGEIKPEQLKTLSMIDQDTGPDNARLNGLRGYRAVKSDEIGLKFVVVEFDKETIVSGVATQGYGDPRVQEWVTQYHVMFDDNSDNFQVPILNSEGKPKVNATV